MKQVILIRNDLKMDKGKLAVQACHASVEAVLRSSREKINEWNEKGSKKAILRVESEKDLFRYQQLAKTEKLTTAMITDAAKTFFKQPTITCLGIGPDKESKIDKITGKLKLI